ncbi:CHAT domain-containing protein [Nodularia spumigena]|uniref:CHAT domain-containing protein n=1 Tax=Nodularia spumigena TaxID=70799 RepID=UPI0023310DE5|nr:CHAT domain-containing protein [Nodularia spumigena]MDB9341352.1 CHAT domain-containing protein [Nodularia spumigena CS-589/07]MDB9500204.1 CHAT domain-containing protein [Nodularia spumigena CS-336/02]
MSTLFILATLAQIAIPVSLPRSLANHPVSIALVQATSDADLLLEQGLKLYQLERYAEAAKIFQQVSQSTSNSLSQAQALNYLSLTYQQLGQLSDAEEAIKQSFQLLPQKTGTKEYLSIRAQALNTQGKLLLAQGKSETALDIWDEAIATYGKIGDNDGKIGSQINQAKALQTLGFYRRSRDTLENVKKNLDKQPDSPLKVTGLLSLGNALRIVGDVKASQSILAESCEIETKRLQLTASCDIEANDLQSKENIPAQSTTERLAEIFVSLGNTAQAQEKNQEALQFYQRAANTSQQQTTQLQAQINRLRLSVNLLAIATNEEAISQLETSSEESSELETSSEESSEIAASSEESSEIEASSEESSEIEASSEESSEIETSSGESSEIAASSVLEPSEIEALSAEILAQLQVLPSELDKLPPSRSSIYARINFAQSLVKLTKIDGATKGIISIEDNCTSVNSLCTAAKVLVTGVKQAKELADVRAESHARGTLGCLYEQTQQWSEAQKLTEQALQLAEGIRAKDIAYNWYWQLGRLLSKADNPQSNSKGAIASYEQAISILKTLRRDLSAVNRESQFSFEDEVTPVYREYVNLLLPKTGEPSQDNLDKARKVIESLQLAELDNYFRTACLDTQAVLIENIDQSGQTAVVYPIILSDRLVIILSVPNSENSQTLKFHTVPISEKEFANTIEYLRQKLVLRSTREFLIPSQQVYNWLIAPMESNLANSGVKNLVFVLDGTLQTIPIAALYDQDKKEYLVQKGYNIAITPGLELLPPTPFTSGRLQAVVGGLSEARDNFPPLPGVENELKEIQKILSDSQTFINDSFTSQKIEQTIKLSPFPIVHLATHGNFSSKAEDTFILSWNKRVNVSDLGSLLTTRGEQQSQVIELLVLSACQTASGDNRAALGIAGVAIQSGARSTLASVWSVNDDATADLMVNFYQNLAKKNTKAESLRRAQLALLEGEDSTYKHPYYWSPFILVGNWQ